MDVSGIELFTDAGERSARPLIGRFEQIREFFRQAGIDSGPLRLRVFVFASAEELHRFREGADGFYQSAPERDYIAMHAGPEAGRVAFHEYVHLVLRHSSVPLPNWFNEGMAEFYSTVQLQKDRLRVGDPIPAHLNLLASASRLDEAALARRDPSPIFYAESWALVHMLNLSPKWRDGMPQFVLLLAKDKPADEAFREAFGRSIADALADLRVYVKDMRATMIPGAIGVPDEPRVSKLSDEEGSIASAGLALAVRRTELASKLIGKFFASAGSESMRGTIALAEGRREEARQHLERAIALGSRDASLYFEYAMMERESGRPDPELLKKVIEIDPGFADAQFLLGVRETDEGDLRSAISHLRAATAAQPDRSNYWHALAYAESKAGAPEAALSIRRAMRTAANDQEMKMAEALLGLDHPQERSQLKMAVVTPESWQGRKGNARMEGTLIEFDCSGPAIKIRDLGGAITTLKIAHPSDIKLVNAAEPTFQFSCGAQQMRVSVEYDRDSMEVTQIEFRL